MKIRGGRIAIIALLWFRGVSCWAFPLDSSPTSAASQTPIGEALLASLDRPSRIQRPSGLPRTSLPDSCYAQYGYTRIEREQMWLRWIADRCGKLRRDAVTTMMDAWSLPSPPSHHPIYSWTDASSESPGTWRASLRGLVQTVSEEQFNRISNAPRALPHLDAFRPCRDHMVALAPFSSYLAQDPLPPLPVAEWVDRVTSAVREIEFRMAHRKDPQVATVVARKFAQAQWAQIEPYLVQDLLSSMKEEGDPCLAESRSLRISSALFLLSLGGFQRAEVQADLEVIPVQVKTWIRDLHWQSFQDCFIPLSVSFPAYLAGSPAVPVDMAIPSFSFALVGREPIPSESERQGRVATVRASLHGGVFENVALEISGGRAGLQPRLVRVTIDASGGYPWVDYWDPRFGVLRTASRNLFLYLYLPEILSGFDRWARTRPRRPQDPILRDAFMGCMGQDAQAKQRLFLSLQREYPDLVSSPPVPGSTSRVPSSRRQRSVPGGRATRPGTRSSPSHTP